MAQNPPSATLFNLIANIGKKKLFEYFSNE
jgi:hypothetical protein